jgi:hypothetical protein
MDFGGMSVVFLGDVNKHAVLAEGEKCDACAAPCAKLVCGACRTTRYCGRECQRSHWLAHKPACFKHRNNASSLNLLDVRVLIKKRTMGFPIALRGDRLFSVQWDTLDVSAINMCGQLRRIYIFRVLFNAIPCFV